MEIAENEPTRENYNQAFTSISTLSQTDSDLEDRLRVVDEWLSKEEKIKEATLLVEEAESQMTRSSFEKASQRVASLSTKNRELENRLGKVEELLLVDEQKVEEANTSLVQAEKSKTRKDYEQAQLLVTSLPNQNNEFIKRLKIVDTDIQKQEKQAIEEQKLAEEKALAAEVEQARIAEEQLAAERAAQEEANAIQVQEIYNSEVDDSNAVYVEEYEEGAIKGSVNGIYHTPGSTYYSRTKNVVQWFHTVEEAEAAGYRAPE